MPEYLSATEAAARIRADIAAAAKAGELGDYPQGTRFTVKAEYASLMSQVTVTVRRAPDEWAVTDVDRGFGPQRGVTPAAKELGAKLAEIARRHYQPERRHRFLDVRLAAGGRTFDLV